MKNKKIQLKTKHLCIIPKTLEELYDALRNETDPEMQKAYNDMIQGVEANPENWIWYTDWTIILRTEDVQIGSLCFKGTVNALGEVEIGYGIDEPYRRKGYGLEAVNTMIAWAFQNENVYYILAETLADNQPSQGLLKKAGFTLTDKIGEEGPRYEKERPVIPYISIYMSLGMSVGMCFGLSVFDNLALGMCFGMGIGIALGAALDQKNKKHMEELRQKRNNMK